MCRLAFAGLVSLTVAPVSGQEWARTMFESTSHDFGPIAHNGKAEFEFKFKNRFAGEVHGGGVSTSCGCTTPAVKTPVVKSGEEGVILARVNTDRFVGYRGATRTCRQASTRRPNRRARLCTACGLRWTQRPLWAA